MTKDFYDDNSGEYFEGKTGLMLVPNRKGAAATFKKWMYVKIVKKCEYGFMVTFKNSYSCVHTYTKPEDINLV